MLRRQPTPTPFPYTTLFRSRPRTEVRQEHPRPARWLVGHPHARVVLVVHRCPPAPAVARLDPLSHSASVVDRRLVPGVRLGRSEEHTSELQSLAYLVCRLLL